MLTRIGKISSKRQLTIPKDFCDRLKLGTNVELQLEQDCIKIKKMDNTCDTFDDFSDLILKDLIEEGLTGQELLDEFRLRKGMLPHAVSKLIEDAKAYAKIDVRSSAALNRELFEED